MENIISDGIHYLSGIGYSTKEYGWSNKGINVYLFCIDGKTYGAYEDPDDGYRSFGCLEEMDAKCQYTFPPQAVRVVNKRVDRKIEHDGWLEYENKFMIHILDAVNGKEVLVVGTDYSESYYPMAIFNYTPENLEINKNC